MGVLRVFPSFQIVSRVVRHASLSQANPSYFSRAFERLGYSTIIVLVAPGTYLGRVMLIHSTVQIYSDIDESWTGQNGSTVSNFTAANEVSLFELSSAGAATYEEADDMALWGDVVFASRPANSTVTQQSGPPSSVRAQFAGNGILDGATPSKSDSRSPFFHFELLQET